MKWNDIMYMVSQDELNSNRNAIGMTCPIFKVRLLLWNEWNGISSKQKHSLFKEQRFQSKVFCSKYQCSNL